MGHTVEHQHPGDAGSDSDVVEDRGPAPGAEPRLGQRRRADIGRDHRGQHRAEGSAGVEAAPPDAMAGEDPALPVDEFGHPDAQRGHGQAKPLRILAEPPRQCDRIGQNGRAPAFGRCRDLPPPKDRAAVQIDDAARHLGTAHVDPDGETALGPPGSWGGWGHVTGPQAAGRPPTCPRQGAMPARRTRRMANPAHGTRPIPQAHGAGRMPGAFIPDHPRGRSGGPRRKDSLPPRRPC